MAFGGIFLEISRHYTLCTKINFLKKNLVKSNQAAKRKIYVSFCQNKIRKYCHAMAFGGIFLEMSRHYIHCALKLFFF